MSRKNKKDWCLCEWKKNSYGDDLDLFRELVLDPRFYCTKCGRVAAKKKAVCKPAKLIPEKRAEANKPQG